MTLMMAARELLGTNQWEQENAARTTEVAKSVTELVTAILDKMCFWDMSQVHNPEIWGKMRGSWRNKTETKVAVGHPTPIPRPRSDIEIGAEQ